MRLKTLVTLFGVLCIASFSCRPDPQSLKRELTLAVVSGVEGDALKYAATAYEARTGIHINIAEFPYANLFEKELIDLKARTGAYDLIMLDDPWFPEFASRTVFDGSRATFAAARQKWTSRRFRKDIDCALP